MLSPKNSLLLRGMFCFASLLGVIALFTAASVRPSYAATVTQVNSDISITTTSSTETRDRWRTKDYVKLLDGDGSAGSYVYGTAGYRLYAAAGGQGGSPPGVSLPTFVSSVTALVNGTQGPINGWADIDNASAPFAGNSGTLSSSVPDVNSGRLFNNNTGVGDPLKAQPAGTEGDFLEITLSANQSFRLGIIAGNDDGIFQPAALRVRQTAGAGSGDSLLMTADLSNTDFTPDYYFFDIVGGVAGDKYRVSLVSKVSASGTVCMHGVTFDVLAVADVPEPSTFVLAALGLAGLGLVAWRKRK